MNDQGGPNPSWTLTDADSSSRCNAVARL